MRTQRDVVVLLGRRHRRLTSQHQPGSRASGSSAPAPSQRPWASILPRIPHPPKRRRSAESRRPLSTRPRFAPTRGVPKGEVRGPFTLPSQAYPGTQHTYWVYVPAQYDPAKPASLMIFNDGQAFKNMEGDVRAPNVLDNLIYRREIPVMLARVHQSRPHARSARADAAGLGRPRRPTGRPSTTRSTTSTPA